jgi:hypothetical protein
MGYSLEPFVVAALALLAVGGAQIVAACLLSGHLWRGPRS